MSATRMTASIRKSRRTIADWLQRVLTEVALVTLPIGLVVVELSALII
jgi:hypothetical protein